MALEFEYDEQNSEEHISTEDFLKNEREAAKKAREAKRLKKKYKFSDKKHSRTGIISSVCALCSFLCLVGAVVVSTMHQGEGGVPVGALGAVSFVLAITGMVLGLVSFRKTDVLLKFAWTGLISSIVIWILDAVLIVMGL